MSLFDSVISSVKDSVGLGDDKIGALLSALLSYITDADNGGISGFIERFRSAGLGDLVNSWISTGEANEPLSDEQVESVLGKDVINSMAISSGMDSSTATTALGGLIPGVVDSLTPDAEIPDNDSIIDKISGFLAEWGASFTGAVAGGAAAASAMAGSAADRVGDAVSDGIHSASAAAGAAKDSISDGIRDVGNAFSSDPGPDSRNSYLKWIFLLILLGLIVALGYMFCGRGTTPAVNSNTSVNRTAANANTTAATVDSSFRLEARDGKYFASGVVHDQTTFDNIKSGLEAQFGAGKVDLSGLKIDAGTKPFDDEWWENFSKLLPSLKDWKTGAIAFAGNAVTEANGLPSAAIDQIKSLFSGWKLPDVFGSAASTRSLTEIHLPSGAKLQAYPGGIEDQMVKFITSDEYKNATDETLKSKWFDFDDLNFKFGTTELDDNSKRQLDNIVAILKEFNNVKIKIGGYTDKKGDDAANKALSDRRAKAVQSALNAAGVGSQVPEAEGYGEEFAKVPESASDEERKVDRRTSIRLIK